MPDRYYGDEDLRTLQEYANDPDPSVRALAIAAMTESEKTRKAEEAAGHSPTRSEKFASLIDSRFQEAIAERDGEHA